jgi:sulfoquinovosyltransferase
MAFRYLPGYNLNWLLGPTWCLIRCLHRSADLTLVPSVAIAEDFETAKVVSANRIRLWNKGVDSESFHPKFWSLEMRVKLRYPLFFKFNDRDLEKTLAG